MSKAQLRNIFQTKFPFMDFTRGEREEYQDPRTELCWVMFQVGFESGQNSRLSKQRGHCVIGYKGEHGKPVFSIKPHIHDTVFSAEKEKARLSLKHPEKKFMIYRYQKPIQTKGV